MSASSTTEIDNNEENKTIVEESGSCEEVQEKGKEERYESDIVDNRQIKISEDDRIERGKWKQRKFENNVTERERESANLVTENDSDDEKQLVFTKRKEYNSSNEQEQQLVKVK